MHVTRKQAKGDRPLFGSGTVSFLRAVNMGELRKLSSIVLSTALAVVAVLLFAPFLAHSQTRNPGEKRIAVGFIYEALTLTNTPIWVAEDQGLFDKYGLDVKIILARGATPVQALVSGSVEFGGFSGSSTVAANLGGSDLVFIAAKQ